MEIVTDDSDGAVSTEDKPIVPHGLRLRCENCDTEFKAGDGGKWIPGGHKKWSEFRCPSCESRVAKEKGTNRAFFEDYIDLTVSEAFAKRCEDDDKDPDQFELVHGGEVEPKDVGHDIIAVFEYYPGKGVTNWLEVNSDDVIRERDEPDAYVFNSEEIEAVVRYWEKTDKPIGYGDAFGEPQTAEDVRFGKQVLRFVKVVE